MKACIVTVYNSENCGSFWQAYALKTYVESLGFRVYFLKRKMKGSSHTLKATCKKAISKAMRGNLKNAVGQIIQYLVFSRMTAVFDTVDECDDSFDVCILGSDTIWNLNEKYFAGEREAYWGHTSRAQSTISYAASIANTQPDTIDAFPEVIQYLENLRSIGVRDQHTLNVLSAYTNRPMKLVCDPTMLFDKSFYGKMCRENRRGEYLFVYYFRRMPAELEQQIRAFSREKKLKIVVMGNSMEGDEQIYAYSPTVFLECFCHAEYVVTNTFHGTIFSILFEKNAFFNSDGKQKVMDILEKVSLSERDYSQTTNPETLFHLPDIDYRDVDRRVSLFRCESQEYLKSAIAGDRQ